MSYIIERLLAENPESIFVFDVDGVLASYEYGDYNHGYPEYVWENLVMKGDPYQEARSFKIMQEFISRHLENCYIASVCCNENEMWMKRDFIERHYHIDESHMYFTDSKEEKLEVLDDIQLNHPELESKYICIIEDTVDTLNYIQEYSEFSTVHVSSFFS